MIQEAKDTDTYVVSSPPLIKNSPSAAQLKALTHLHISSRSKLFRNTTGEDTLPCVARVAAPKNIDSVQHAIERMR